MGVVKMAQDSRYLQCALKEDTRDQVWRCMPLILEFRRHRQVDLCGFKASLVYIESSRTATVT